MNNIEFADWDDLTESDININKYHVDSGFISNTQVKLLNGQLKQIKDIHIGDILEHGEKVYGLAEIDTNNLLSSYVYDNSLNILIYSTELYNESLPFKCILYHLLTDKKSFHVNNIKVYDYDACIE